MHYQEPHITNFEQLAVTPARRAALSVAQAGLQAIATPRVIERTLSLTGSTLTVGGEAYDLAASGRRVFVVGIGKCAADAGAALEELLGEHINDGVVLGVGAHTGRLKRLAYYEGTHPMPSDQNIAAARAIVELLEGTTERDLVLFVISGGGSTLLCLPETHTCVDEEAILAALYKQAAPIEEVNTLRKHMSHARGGFLAKHAYPAQVISLIFSDIPGGDITHVASGPTVRDTSTAADADAVLAKYDILQQCGIEHCGLLETPKDDAYFARVRNICAVSNRDALSAMREEAQRQGVRPSVCSDRLTGRARDAAGHIVAALRTEDGYDMHLYGGETTVAVTGGGVGGRNQELALAALPDIADNELILTLASDGRDNTEHAGAIADAQARAHANARGLDPQAHLARNDSFTFFAESGDAIVTGRTGVNVSDLTIALHTDTIS